MRMTTVLWFAVWISTVIWWKHDHIDVNKKIEEWRMKHSIECENADFWRRAFERECEETVRWRRQANEFEQAYYKQDADYYRNIMGENK